ncbi:phenylacetate--CoA ligase family protein [Mobilitalea sibirica]|uniref:Phenylacetate--CoA ligase family protein n=1 Tax=Mobilitalea sibirica TaxID=1462919 RepID=A0A8J7GYC4_9FIRM|nr:AMP-binding protein [Mobilitalea sibirica]MBH1940434.1 phenylacetate--CoA ligase family protein [Mobilitalea sibirica]
MCDELLHRINHSLSHACKSSFYQNKAIPKQINSISDFEKIPLTRKDELRNSSPFEVLSVPMSEIQEYHESFGTTGKPVPVWYSRKDMQVSAKQLYNKDLNITKEDISLIRFPYAISVPAHIFSRMFIEQGATIIPVSRGSTVTPYPRVLEIMKRLKTTILACNPSEAILLAKTAVRLGYDVSQDFKIRAICVGGEMLHPLRRKIIEELWKAKVYDYFGSTETANIAVSCGNGNLHCSKDYYLEVLDIKDGKTVSKEGKGFLVVTQLNNEAFPLIRYHTGDIVEIKRSDCPCGNDEDIMIHHGRYNDLIQVGSQSCTMYELQEALFTCENMNEIIFWKMHNQKDQLFIYIEGEPKGSTTDIKLNLPFPNKVIFVEPQEIQNIDKLLEMTELRKASYFI